MNKTDTPIVDDRVDAILAQKLGSGAEAIKMIDLARELERELTQLRADVQEWACVACKTVYPGPPQPGFACVTCPKCQGTTAPRATVERMALRDQLEQCVAESCKWAARAGRAERALERAGFTDLGGQEWKPPLGKMPVARLQAMDDPRTSGLLDIVILDRARCHDGMLLFDGAFHHEDPRATRWDFMMRVMDNPGGPEDKMGDAVEVELADKHAADGRPRSEQIAEVVDTARARLAAQSNDLTESEAAQLRDAFSKMSPPAYDPNVRVYTRDTFDDDDRNTRTVDRTIALRWKQAGHVVTPDPEAAPC